MPNSFLGDYNPHDVRLKESNRQASMFREPKQGSEQVDPHTPETLFFESQEPTEEYLLQGTFLDPRSESFQPVNINIANGSEQPEFEEKNLLKKTVMA